VAVAEKISQAQNEWCPAYNICLILSQQLLRPKYTKPGGNVAKK